MVRGQAGVGLVEEEQILTFHVEDQRVCVGGGRPEHAGAEQRMQHEHRVGRLGGDTRDAGDVHVRAACAVEEFQVPVDDLTVAAQPEREASGHLIEEEGALAVIPCRALHRAARQRWHVDLGLQASDADVRGPRRAGRQDRLLHQKDVGVELHALVPGFHDIDHAVQGDRLTVGQLGADDHDVVQLEVLALLDGNPELQRHRVLGAEDPSNAHRMASAREVRSRRRIQAGSPSRCRR